MYPRDRARPTSQRLLKKTTTVQSHGSLSTLQCSPFTGSLSSSKATASTVPNVSAAPRSPAGRGPRRKQYGGQATKLEAADDPLGPLGAPTPPSGPEVPPPAPPQKEPAGKAARATPGTSTSSLPGMMNSVNLEEEDDDKPTARGPRVPPPVQPSTASASQRQTQPSVSVEQAAKPTFTIYVGDPHKVGDLTSSHTEYSVMTKVSRMPYLRL